MKYVILATASLCLLPISTALAAKYDCTFATDKITKKTCTVDSADAKANSCEYIPTGDLNESCYATKQSGTEILACGFASSLKIATAVEKLSPSLKRDMAISDILSSLKGFAASGVTFCGSLGVGYIEKENAPQYFIGCFLK